MAQFEQKDFLGGLGGGGRGGQGRRRAKTPFDDIRIQSTAQPINQGDPSYHLGNAANAPVNPLTGAPLVDSMGNPLEEGRYYGTGRTKQVYTSGGSGTTRIPLVGAFRTAVLNKLENKPGSPIGDDPNLKYPNLPESDRLFVSVDNDTGILPDNIGGDRAQAAIAQGSDAGIGFIKSGGNASMKVGGTSFVNALKNRAWPEQEEAKNVAFAMLLGGTAQAQNLASAGYLPNIDGNGVVQPGSLRGSGNAVKPLAAKSGNRRLAGQHGFAMRASQQSKYWVGGNNPDQFSQALATRGRDQNGMVQGDQVVFPMNQQELKALKDKGFVGTRGRVRTGQVFVPRDQSGNPMHPLRGDAYDNRYQCKVENSGPGISNFTDAATGQDSAGFRLFKRRTKSKTGGRTAVACGYSPDIFVNTETASYRPVGAGGDGRRTIGNNSLAEELANRAGGPQVAQRLAQGYQALNANRDAFYGRSLKPKPRAGQETLRDMEWQMSQGANPVYGTQAKLQAWQQNNDLL